MKLLKGIGEGIKILAVAFCAPFLIIFFVVGVLGPLAIFHTVFSIGFLICLWCLPCQGWPHTKEPAWPGELFSVTTQYRPLTSHDWKYIGIMFLIGTAAITVAAIIIATA
jgi:ABC-type phosphate transport system permease subunit